MNCPRCNSPSAEGKKYCADCGTPLDPQTIRFEALVKDRVEETISQRFKDQKILELETSQAIAERLHSWAKLFAFFVGLPFAALAIVLAVAGIDKYSDFKNLINGVEQQVKPKVEQAKTSAEQAQRIADDAQKKAEAAQKTTEAVTRQVNEQLGSATQLVRNVQSLSTRMSELEKQTSGQINASTQRVEARVSELNQKIDAATKDIADQQKKLASTDELVKALFSKGQTEYFQTAAPAPNVLIKPLSDHAVLVYMLLKSVPILQTIEVKWRVYSQPRGSYSITNNVLFFMWGESAENLKPYPLEVTYVPDPTAKIRLFKTLVLKENAIYADETKLTDLPK